MRAGLLIYGDLGQRTGGYLYDRMLVRGLARRGVSVEVVSLPETTYAGRLLHNRTFDFGALAARGFDVLLEDELAHPSLVHTWARSRPPGASPLRVAIVHNLSWPAETIGARGGPTRLLRSMGRALERRYLAGVDGMIFNSRATRAEVQRLVPALPPHVVAYPAADHLWAIGGGSIRTATTTPAGGATGATGAAATPRDAVRLLFVGNLSPVKGLHLLLPALAALAAEPWTLDVVGSLTRDPAYVTSVKRALAAHGLEQRVRLHGELPEQAVAALYRACSIFVLTSPAEGFGIAYLEAMGFGAAVVASPRGAAPELITHGVDGLLVPPEDTQALAAALRGLIRDPARRAALGAAAQASAQARPTWDDCAEAVHGLLLDLHRRPRNSPTR